MDLAGCCVLFDPVGGRAFTKVRRRSLGADSLVPIRYSGVSLPYHIGNGWFGGLLPPIAVALVAATGNIYAGLWYPIAIATMTAVVGFFFLPETHRRDIRNIDSLRGPG